MHPTSEQYCAILDEMKAMHIAKSADYGVDADPIHNLRRSERFGVEPWLATLVRFGDKVTRAETFAKKRTLRNEGFEDTLIDLACYAVLTLILFRERYEKAAETILKLATMTVTESVCEMFVSLANCSVRMFWLTISAVELVGFVLIKTHTNWGNHAESRVKGTEAETMPVVSGDEADRSRDGKVE